MPVSLKKIRRSIVSKLTVLVGFILLVTISVWAYFNIDYQQNKAMAGIFEAADGLSHTIKLGTHYAMMNNLKDDLTRIIKNVAQEKNLENIRIYNKNGEIKYSNIDSELDRMTNIKDEACYICHRTDPPLSELSLSAHPVPATPIRPTKRFWVPWIWCYHWTKPIKKSLCLKIG